MALINCQNCNKQISDKASVCPHCGYELSTEISINNAILNDDTPLKEKPKKKINGKKIGILAGIVAIAVIISIIAIVLIGGMNNDADNDKQENNNTNETSQTGNVENKPSFSLDAKPVDGKEYQYENFVYIIYDDNSIEITKYLGSDDGVTISEEINGYLVSRIGASAFEGCSFIEDIYLYANIVSIGDNAFKNCTSLEDFKIPEGMISIGASAFEGCTSMTDVYVYGGKTIGDCAFKNCTSLEDFKIPEGMTSIGVSAFEGCTSMTDVYVYGGETIGDYAFKNCTSLEDFKIPEGMISIGVSAFENCSSMTDVYVYGGKTIGDCAFKNCTSLEDFKIPEGMERIGVSAFEGCTNLEDLYIYSDDVEYGVNAFANCPKLEDMPEGAYNDYSQIDSSSEKEDSIETSNGNKFTAKESKGITEKLLKEDLGNKVKIKKLYFNEGLQGCYVEFTSDGKSDAAAIHLDTEVIDYKSEFEYYSDKATQLRKENPINETELHKCNQKILSSSYSEWHFAITVLESENKTSNNGWEKIK